MELNATFFVQLAILLVLLFVLGPVLFAPMMRVFEEREKRIVGAAEEAKRQSGSAEEKLALVDKRLKEAQDEARKQLAMMREHARAAEQTTLEEARTKAAARLEEARSELFAETETARRGLKDQANTITDQIVAKVLGRAA
jgi:F-type H+-transporting ATPase subunit b